MSHSTTRLFVSLFIVVTSGLVGGCPPKNGGEGEGEGQLGEGEGEGGGGGEGEGEGQDGPPGNDVNQFPHQEGNATSGQSVFRLETFGDEGFWTDAVRLPDGIVAAGFTPKQALQAGLNVNIDAVDAASQAAIAAELQTDLSPQNAPLLNSVDTTVKLIEENAVIGVVTRDTNGDGQLNLAGGDKVGVSCALCHAITDASVFALPGGGTIGHEVDGPTPHTLNVGAIFALAANTRALYPISQTALTANGGATIGRAPTGLTETSTEAEFDAYFGNPDFYPVGMFDDQPDGNGAPMHIVPMFRQDLAAPYGSEGAITKLDNFSNLVFTVLFDLRDITTDGGRAFLHKLGGAAGDEIVSDYVTILADTGVDPTPGIEVSTTGTPGDEATPIGIRVDNQKLLDMNAYLDSLQAPPGQAGDAQQIARARTIFRSNCTSCHNVDQGHFVPQMIVPMATIFPGDNPVVLAQRDPPLNPIENTVASIFDDKMVVVNASIRGDIRGTALPLLLDLARKPVFLHDNEVPSLDNLLDPSRGATAPHPFYLDNANDRAAMVTYLKSLDTTSH